MRRISKYKVVFTTGKFSGERATKYFDNRHDAEAYVYLATKNNCYNIQVMERGDPDFMEEK